MLKSHDCYSSWTLNETVVPWKNYIYNNEILKVCWALHTNIKGKTVLFRQPKLCWVLHLTVWCSSLIERCDRFSYNFLSMVLQLNSHKQQEMHILISAKQILLQNLAFLSIDKIFSKSYLCGSWKLSCGLLKSWDSAFDICKVICKDSFKIWIYERWKQNVKEK